MATLGQFFQKSNIAQSQAPLFLNPQVGKKNYHPPKKCLDSEADNNNRQFVFLQKSLNIARNDKPIFILYNNKTCNISISSRLSHFVKEKYFQGNMGTYTIGELPSIMPQCSSAGVDPSKYTEKIKREFFTLSGSPSVGGSSNKNLLLKFLTKNSITI